VVLGLVAAALILIPLLFFGVELIIFGLLLGAGLAGQIVLRRPWVIEARSRDPFGAGRQLEWRVRGWRNSGKVMDEVAARLESGEEPPHSTPSE
jgi:hypothetical protein